VREPLVGIIRQDLKLCSYLFFSAGSVLLLLAPLAGVAAEVKPAAEPSRVAEVTPIELHVHYEKRTRRFSINASRVPLEKVFELIGKNVPVKVEYEDKQLLKSTVSTTITSKPLEEALEKLLKDYNVLFVYSAVDNPGTKTPRTVLVKVSLLSKKESVPADLPTAREVPRIETQATVNQDETPSKGVELIRAIVANKPNVAKEMVKALKEKGTEKEMEEAVAALLNTMLEPIRSDDASSAYTYYESLRALKELAQERAETLLENWLHGEDPEMRVVGATGLGFLENESGIAPLRIALTADDLSTRKVAVGSLARIGGERATEILFQAYFQGDEGLQKEISSAIAFHGDENSQEALAELMYGGQLPEGANAQDAIINSLPKEEGQIGNAHSPDLMSK
jgi:hypothetical protein